MPSFKRNLLILACLAVCGCSWFDDDYEYHWTRWVNAELVSIVDDSLAILSVYKYKIKTWESCDGCEREERIISYPGLFLVNYRVKQKPLLGDTLIYNSGIARDYFKDSSVLVFDDRNEKFGFWKIGTKSIEFKKITEFKSDVTLNYKLYEYGARPWTNENILLLYKGYIYSEIRSLLLLDTKDGQIRPFNFSGEYEWLSECVDMLHVEGKIVCIRKNLNKFELVVNGRVMDSNSLLDGVSAWYGNYIKDKKYDIGDTYIGEIYKIDMQNFKFDNIFIPIWVSDMSVRFYESNKDLNNFISYSSMYLVE